MKNFRVRVIIETVGEKVGDTSEVHLGNLQAESMAEIVAFAGTFGAAFADNKKLKDPVAEHERLVGLQNQG